MKKGKFLVLGLIALMLLGGIIMASCNNDPPGPCCSASTFTALIAADLEGGVDEYLAAFAQLPGCCQERVEAAWAFDDMINSEEWAVMSPSQQEALMKNTLGCCYDTFVAMDM